MADLGVIGFEVASSSINLIEPIVTFKTSTTGDTFFNAFTLDVNFFSFVNFLGVKEAVETTGFSIKGITRKDGIVSSKIVRLYERLTGRMVSELQSGLDGYFEFKDVSPSTEFYVVVLDNELNTAYDAEICDHIFSLEG